MNWCTGIPPAGAKGMCSNFDQQAWAWMSSEDVLTRHDIICAGGRPGQIRVRQAPYIPEGYIT